MQEKYSSSVASPEDQEEVPHLRTTVTGLRYVVVIRDTMVFFFLF